MNARALERRRRRSVERRRSVSAQEFTRAVDRPAERVDDASLPGSMRRQRQSLGSKGARADGHLAARVERLEGGRGIVDPDHFADLNAIADIDADALAQFEKARQAGDAVVRHRDFDDRAAYARGRMRPQSLRDPLFEPLKRREIVRASVGHAVAPKALIASCSDVSDCEVSAATPSKALVTSISLVISRTGSTFEPSTAP